MIKLFLLFRRVVGGALDLDVEEGYKPAGFSFISFLFLYTRLPHTHIPYEKSLH